MTNMFIHMNEVRCRASAPVQRAAPKVAPTIDEPGHPTGDLVLQSFGSVLHEGLRPFDVAGRYGGEEFCVLLPGTGIGEATQIAERLRAIASQTPVSARAGRISYTVSTGVVQAPPRPISLEELVDRADRALYEAKAAGRNCVRAV